MKLKILQVIDQLNVGGAERVLVELSNLLLAHGHEVNVLTLVRPGDMAALLHPQIVLINLGRRNKFSLAALARVNRECKGYDIVHVHLRYNLRYVGLARLIFGGKFKILFHDHFGDIEKDTRIPTGIKFFATRKHTWFAGVSAPLVAWAEDVLKLEKSKISLLPNIVVRRNAAAEKVANTEGVVRLIKVANYRESKNHIFAIQLIDVLRKEFQVHLDLVGRIIEREYFESLVNEVDRLQLQQHISFVTDCDDVQKILSRYDAAVHTASMESGPLVLIEYLAQHTKFVSYRTGQVSEQIVNDLPEFFLDTFVISRWVKAIKDVLSMDQHVFQRMENCFQSSFSSERFYEQCNNIYKMMMKHQ